MFDIKICGGHVLDGTGGPAVELDVGIAGDKIAALEPLSGAQARHTINLAAPPGKAPSTHIVCPGFIDAHSHSDAYLLIEPSSPSKLFQGITTEVTGNCGASAAPLLGDYRMPSDWRDKSYPGEWRSMADYRGLLESIRPAVNVVPLVGHNALRVGVSGYENRPMTASELGAMVHALDRAMDEGGRGLSTGLVYAPGMFAPHEEIAELARTVARHNGTYTSHMRSEGKHLLEAITETLDIGRATGVRVQISHLKTSGRANWGQLDQALELIRDARRQGLPAAADRYPYTAACTDLDVIFPDWAAEGGGTAVLQRLRDPSVRRQLREDLLASRSEDYWDTITIGSTAHPDNAALQGTPLTEVAKQLGMEPIDAVLYLEESDELKTSAFFFGMSEDNMHRVLAEPYVMVGSDASLRSPTGPLSHDFPHPRAYGSFTRVLRMSLDGQTVPLPEVIRKMTALPAEQFGLRDRGTLEVGRKADLIVFDPTTLREAASYAAPHQLSEGLEHMIVNGVVTLADGKPTGDRAGRFL